MVELDQFAEPRRESGGPEEPEGFEIPWPPEDEEGQVEKASSLNRVGSTCC